MSRARQTATVPGPAATGRPQPRLHKHDKVFKLVPCGREGSLEKKAKFEPQRQGQGQERTRPQPLLPLRRFSTTGGISFRRTWTRTSSSLRDCLPSRGADGILSTALSPTSSFACGLLRPLRRSLSCSSSSLEPPSGLGCRRLDVLRLPLASSTSTSAAQTGWGELVPPLPLSNRKMPSPLP